ncbi:hypothetical protein ACHAW5_008980 [Stephanodiscus triporus]|uniref:HMG box domain-containing protein n=1 Tax=Stephanodiscus triporus TaxID=2934178 RepID=A0ABD3PWX6_9STRA
MRGILSEVKPPVDDSADGDGYRDEDKEDGAKEEEGCIEGNDITAEKENGEIEPCDERNLAGRQTNDDEKIASPSEDNAPTTSNEGLTASDAVIIVKNEDEGKVPAASPMIGGFRPKMPRRRLSQDTCHLPKEDDFSKKRNQITISPEEYHLKVCLPRRRGLAAKLRKARTAMNKLAAGIYSTDPTMTANSSVPLSDMLIPSRPSWDVRDKASMGCSFGSLGRDPYSGLMPEMSPAIYPKALSSRNSGGNNSLAVLDNIACRDDGRGEMDGVRDMVFRNPELWEHMLRTMKAGGNPMMGMGANRSETISDVSNNPPKASMSTLYDAYHYAHLGKRKLSLDMMEDSSHLYHKSPGNPKKSFLQRERDMDAEVRNHMMEALLKENMKRMGNLPLLTSLEEGNERMDNNNVNTFNQDTFCMNTVDALDVDTVHKGSSMKSMSSSKMSRDEFQASKKKTDPPPPKKSKTPKSDFNSEQASTLLAVMGLSGMPVMPEKPKRPFSLYNLFFQLEREYILNEIREGRKHTEDHIVKDALSSSAEGESKTGPVITGDTTATTRTGKASPTDDPQTDSEYFYDPDIPARYSHLRLEKHWYSVGHKQKRKHRKTEGSCSFMDLTRMVSSYWKNIETTDPYIKQYCQKLAHAELDVYKKEVDKYKKAVKKAELDAKAKVLLLKEENGTDLSPPVKSASTTKAKRTVDQGTSENKKKLKRDFDEDFSETSKKKTKLEGRPFTSDDQNHQHLDYKSRLGGVDDMMDVNDYMMGGRFAEMARMSGSFPGFLDSGGKNDNGVVRSPAGDRTNLLAARMAEARMMAGGAFDSRGVGGDETSMADVRGFFDDAVMRMRETFRKPTEDQRIFDPRKDKARVTADFNVRDKKSMNLPSDFQHKLAALAEAEAMHRMQIEMQSDMKGNCNNGTGSWQEMNRDTHPYQRGETFPSGAKGMRGMSQGSGQNGFPQDSGLPSSMQRKFLEQYGMNLSGGRGVGNVPAHYPPDGGADMSQEQFDMEVDQFLLTLKEEIKENSWKQLMRGGGGGGSSANASFMRGSGGNSASASSNGGNIFGMEGGIGGMEGMVRSVGAVGHQDDLVAPSAALENVMEMRAKMMELRAQMMDQMRMIRMASNAGGSCNNSNEPSPNQPNSRMMDEMMRRQVAGNSHGGTSMPVPPFYAHDNIRGGELGDDGWGDDGS